MNKHPIILIPNATSPRNVGNQAIMTTLVTLLRETYRGCDIRMQGFDPELQKDRVTSVKHSLYSWAVFARKNPFIRLQRMVYLFMGLAHIPVIPKELSEIFQEYSDADLIVFEPGGYLSTRPGFSQTLNFFMQLLPIFLATRLGKKTIQSPFSIGPFAYRWQEWLTCKIFNHVDLIFTREDITHSVLTSHSVVVERSNDLVFFLPDKPKRIKKRVIGVVMRQWSIGESQTNIEQHIAQSIAVFAKKKGFRVLPIVQSHAPEYKDFDHDSAIRVSNLLTQSGITVLPLEIISTPNAARSLYASLDVLISMRMHAGLFALMEGVPAIVITDETKAKGIFGRFGIPELVLSLKDLSSLQLIKTINFVQKNKKQINRNVSKTIHNIKGTKRLMKERIKKLYNTKTPSVTVAISAYNEEQNITTFLKSVLSQIEEGFTISRIIVISDGSTDRTVLRARTLQNKKIVIKHYKKRLGKSLHLNTLYKTLDTDYLIQSDADVVFGTRYVIRDMVNAMQKNPEIGLSGGNPIPLPAETFVEAGINSTVSAYQRLRTLVRNGNNPFSADGRLLGLSRSFAKTITIPHDMIANDRYAYYVCKTTGWNYTFIPTAVVYFRSPQTMQDHIRQNTRFIAAPARLRRYFPAKVVNQEESIPWYLKMFVFLEQLVQHPLTFPSIIIVNRYCEIRANKKERNLTALWDMAVSTKTLTKKAGSF